MLSGKMEDLGKSVGSRENAAALEYPEINAYGEYGTYQSKYEGYKSQLLGYPEFEYLKYEDNTPKTDADLFYPEMMYKNKLEALSDKINDLRYNFETEDDGVAAGEISNNAEVRSSGNGSDDGISAANTGKVTQEAVNKPQNLPADIATFTHDSDTTEEIKGRAAKYYKQFDNIIGAETDKNLGVYSNLDAETVKKLIAYSEKNKLDTEYVLDTVGKFKTKLTGDKTLQHLSEPEQSRYAVFKAFEEAGKCKPLYQEDKPNRELAGVADSRSSGVKSNDDNGYEVANKTGAVDDSSYIAAGSGSGKVAAGRKEEAKDYSREARQLQINDRLNTPSIYFIYRGKELEDKAEYYGIDRKTIVNFGRGNNFREFIGRRVEDKYQKNPAKKGEFDYYTELAKEKEYVETDSLRSLAVNTLYRESVFRELASAADPLGYLKTFDRDKISAYCRERFADIPFYQDNPEVFVRKFGEQIARGKDCLVFYSAHKKDAELLKRYSLSYNIQGGIAIAGRRLYGALVGLYDPASGREYIREAERVNNAVQYGNDIGLSPLGARGGNLLSAISELGGYATAGVIAAEATPIITLAEVEVTSGVILLELLNQYADHLGIEVTGKEQGLSQDEISQQQWNQLGRTGVNKTATVAIPYYNKIKFIADNAKKMIDQYETEIKADSFRNKVRNDNRVSNIEYRDIYFK